MQLFSTMYGSEHIMKVLEISKNLLLMNIKTQLNPPESDFPGVHEMFRLSSVDLIALTSPS